MKKSVLILSVLLFAACSPQVGSDWSAVTASTCSGCNDQQDYVDDLVDERLAARAAELVSFSVADEYEGDLAQCYKVGLIPWDDDFNCRDFTRWFIECMEKLGHQDVEGLSMWCKGCDSEKAYAHRIVIYEKPDGNWCPGEPQWETGGEKGDCCKATKSEASQCALDLHCASNGKRDACCEADGFKNRSAKFCKGEPCRYEVDVNGEPFLICDLPVIGAPDAQPVPDASSPQSPTACQAAVKNCIAQNPASCADCKKENLVPPCCGEAATNSACTSCCNSTTPGYPSPEWQACTTDAGCATKPD